MFEARNAIAIGMPTSISTTMRPSSSAMAQYHSIALRRRVARTLDESGAVGTLATDQQSEELERHHAEGERHGSGQHPARHVERTHVLFVAEVVLQGDRAAVPGEHHGDSDAADHDQLDQCAAHPFGQRCGKDLDVDVALFAHQPGRAEQRNNQQKILGEGEKVRRALEAEIPQRDVDDDHRHHRYHENAGYPRHAVQDGVVQLDQRGQLGRQGSDPDCSYFGSGPGVKRLTTFPKFSMPPDFSMRSFMRWRLAERAPSTKRLEASGDCATVFKPRFFSSASSSFHSFCSATKLSVSWRITAYCRISRVFGESDCHFFRFTRMCRSVEKKSGRMRYLR